MVNCHIMSRIEIYNFPYIHYSIYLLLVTVNVPQTVA